MRGRNPCFIHVKNRCTRKPLYIGVTRCQFSFSLGTLINTIFLGFCSYSFVCGTLCDEFIICQESLCRCIGKLLNVSYSIPLMHTNTWHLLIPCNSNSQRVNQLVLLDFYISAFFNDKQANSVSTPRERT